MRDYIVSLSMLGLAIFVFFGSGEFAVPGGGLAQDPAYYPKMLALLLVVMSLVLLVSTLMKREKVTFTLKLSSFLNVVKVFVVLVIYVMSVNYVGFLVASILFVPGCALLFKGSPKLALFVGVPLSLVVYYAFTVLLKVPLPRGILFG